ncbi:DUF397 domain-containing protein [Kitasatospora sp. HPMI-4]|uniref:DUF397 domain-containing protein n=1 Tax=Kitasatospora sp. HPMI-4 TaxID=3448443 RepID=UPI003F1CD74E
MNAEESTGPTWFKSSHSGGEGGECVEVALATDAVLVRDSKDEHGPQLSFTPEEWTAFVPFAAKLRAYS